jgi:hypothetical protein
MIDRLHFYNLMYGDDPELKNGDVKIVARGAASLVTKETQMQRGNEFMQLILNNQQVANIVGEEALIDLIRENAKVIGMEDKLPPSEVIRARIYQQQQQAAAMMQAQQNFQMQMALAPSHEVEMQRGPDGEVLGMVVKDKQQHVMQPPQSPMGQTPLGSGANPAQTMSDSGQSTGGRPTTDFFSPMRVH